MEYLYCPNCRKQTGHKRALGWGTFFGGVATLGTSLITIPFYPKRCIVCGRKSDNEQFYNRSITDKMLFYNRPINDLFNPSPPSTSHAEQGKTKSCPACAEKIKLEAIKCRYCGERFDPDDVAKQLVDSKYDDSFENRVLCSDGRCIGVIGTDGRCKECGKPYEENRENTG